MGYVLALVILSALTVVALLLAWVQRLRDIIKEMAGILPDRHRMDWLEAHHYPTGSLGDGLPELAGLFERYVSLRYAIDAAMESERVAKLVREELDAAHEGGAPTPNLAG
jgi:hypothetical protein